MKRSTALVTAGVLAVLTAVLVLVVVLKLATSPEAKVKLGPDVFDTPNTSPLGPGVWQRHNLTKEGTLVLGPGTYPITVQIGTQSMRSYVINP